MKKILKYIKSIHFHRWDWYGHDITPIRICRKCGKINHLNGDGGWSHTKKSDADRIRNEIEIQKKLNFEI